MGERADERKEVLLVGTSHRRAAVELRERLFVEPAEARELAATLADECGEAAVLSTCNRTELYLATPNAGMAASRARAELARISGVDENGLTAALYSETDDAAASHLFRVAAGLDSLVVGEAQILGQVGDALEAARTAGAVGPVLDRLFRHAVSAGRRVRRVLPGQLPSVAASAVELAGRAAGGLERRRVLLIGAGKMNQLAAAMLASRGADLSVASRTLERAEELARRFRGEAVSFERIEDELGRADVVIASTRCPYIVLTAAQVARTLPRRAGRPIVFVDIAVPRDLDRGIGDLEGCSVYDIDDVATIVDANAPEDDALQEAERILAEEVARFREWHRSLAVVPAIASLRRRAEEIRAAELARNERRLRTLSPDERRAVELVTTQIVNKLLHAPTVRMRQAAAAPEAAAYAHALEELFALREDT